MEEGRRKMRERGGGKEVINEGEEEGKERKEGKRGGKKE